MMVQLQTRDGKQLAFTAIPDMKTIPYVLTMGDRCFRLLHPRNHIYRECTSYSIVGLREGITCK